MANDPQLKAICVNSITLERYTGQSVTAQEDYGDPETYHYCHYQGRMRQVNTFAGEEAWSNTTIYCLDDDLVANPPSPRDKITLEAGWEPSQPDLLGIERNYDEDGAHHIVLYV